MKGTNLGEFEELVLLTVAALLEDAYSVAICDELTNNTGRTVKLGVVHAVLNRLEEKGLVKSRLGEATNVRGGKRKRFYTVTDRKSTRLNSSHSQISYAVFCLKKKKKKNKQNKNIINNI